MFDNNYPAKYVNIRPVDFQSGKVPGPIPQPPKWFLEGQMQIANHIKSLITEVDRLMIRVLPEKTRHLENGNAVSVPIVIQMRERGLSKSHRPNRLLLESNTDVIAIHQLGKLIVPVKLENLESMRETLNEILEALPFSREEWLYQKRTKTGEFVTDIRAEFVREFELVHEITAIESIKEYSMEDVLVGMGVEELGHVKEDGIFKVRFFRLANAREDDILHSSFVSHFRAFGLRKTKMSKLKYTGEINCYSVPYISDEVLREIANFPGVESISSYYRFNITYHQNDSSESYEEIVYPEKGKDYPKVAVVDSGISETNRYLNQWVLKRENFVPSNRQNNYHGNFVGGMLVYAPVLNAGLNHVVDSGVSILDVVVLPDPNIEYIREDELLDCLIESLYEHSNEYKVWNLSLGCSTICSGVISEFTTALDFLQDEFGVQFVISTGNFNQLREFGSIDDPLEDDCDRITVPADSVRGITVGAVALDEDEFSLVAKGHVVPYSRKGPGVGLSIKPDVVHYSGNLHNSPIRSIGSSGEILKDFGTSFSTPLVSGILAEYHHLFPDELHGTNGLSRTLARALLIHGSTHPITNKRISEAQDHYYYGFGIPKRLPEILYGNDHEITLIFEGVLNYREGRNWISIGEFPFPASLSTEKKVRGEVLATLAFEPHLNPLLGSEYCRSNVDLRLKSLVDNEFVTLSKGSSAGKAAEERWEKMQMSKQLKWSSAKQIEFVSPSGRKGSENMRLELFPTWRELDEKRSLPFAVVITIRDPKGEALVYKEVSAKLLESFTSSDVAIRYAPTRLSGRQ